MGAGHVNGKLIAALLWGALAFGQADQGTTAQPSSNPQAIAAQATPPPTAKEQRGTTHSVADAARASKQAKQSTPPAKVYRNRDLKDPNDAANASPTSAAAAQTASLPAPHAIAPTPVSTALQTDAEVQKDRAFEAQARVFKNQILVEKGKIVDIQNRMRSLKSQFDAWSASYAQDGDAQACWTSAYYSPYYRDWCDTGRNLKAQYDASLRQLDQEKIRLEKMQENIRRQGYGNAVYDPD
jgi:hypothetical protein